MIIALTGFMGCGKSSVGRELSTLLCCPFMDLDDVIEEVSGRSIPEIFETDGEAAFRRMELETLQYVIGQFPMCSRGPLPLRGPLADPASAGCSQKRSTESFSGTLTTLAGSGKMPLPHNWQSAHSQGDPNASSIHQADTPHDIQLHDISIKNSEKNQTQCVLALGGGTVMTKKCAQMVREHTTCIYLRASVDTLLAHLAGEAEGRPMLSGGCHSERPEGDEESALRSRIENLMARRASTYEKTAHIIIDTDGKSISDICREISDYFHAGHTMPFTRISGGADIF